MTTRHWSIPTLLGALMAIALIAIVASVPRAADACGGFFCNQVPIDQTGEQILFAADGNEIEAIVRIEYEGPSEDFAWIVPTPSNPEIGVSTGTVFSLLNQRLSPRFFLEWSEEGTCEYDMLEGATPDAADGAGGGRDSGVEVVQRDQVGPYDFAVLRAESTEELFAWLEEAEFFIPDDVMPFVEPYIAVDGMHFAAFKLSKGNDAGDIRPVTMRYLGDKPMIPIQLTAIATQPDLGVTAHVLGRARAVPENYLHVLINEARIDWLSGGSNYDEIVTEAANEAGGHAFTTEFAGPTSELGALFYAEGRYDTERLSEIDDPAAFVDEMISEGFPPDSEILALLEQFIPMPEELAESGITPRQFYNCLRCYEESLEDIEFDPISFAHALETEIVEPLEHAQDLLGELPYMTRLYTTLSAEEMTVDPVFAFNETMGDVSNQHTAQAVVLCGDGGTYSDSPLEIRLSDGRVIRYDRVSDAWGGGGRGALDDLPAADSVEETAASGAPVQTADYSEEIDRGLATWNDSQGGAGNAGGSGGDRTPKSGSCATAPAAGAPLWLLVVGVVVVAVRRRTART